MLHTHEAFFLASLPAVVGVPLLGPQLLASVVVDTADGALADQLVFNQKVYALQAHTAAQRLDEITATLQRHRLDVPARPHDGQSFLAFRDALHQTVLGAVATGTAASLAAFVGFNLGEVLLTEHFLATALSLLAVAPDQPALVQHTRDLAARFTKAAAQLAQLVVLPLATPVLRRIGGEIVAALDAVPDLGPEGVDAGRAAAVREHQGQLEKLRQALAAALVTEAPPELLVPSFLLGYLPTATGIPFQCLDLFAQLEKDAPPALLDKSHELTERLRASNRETVDNVLAVEALLQHVKLAAPARPHTAADYFAWLAQIRPAASTTVQPMSRAGGALVLGFFLADLLVTMKVEVATLEISAVAPQHPPVLAQLAASAQAVGSARQNLDQALRHPALPEPARTIGRRLADQVAQAANPNLTQPLSARLAALETAVAALQKGKDELVAVLVQAQQIPV